MPAPSSIDPWRTMPLRLRMDNSCIGMCVLQVVVSSDYERSGERKNGFDGSQVPRRCYITV